MRPSGLDPKFAPAYNNRGLSHNENGDHGPGHRRLHGGHPARSERRIRLLNRSISHYAKGDHDQAIADCTEAIPARPKIRQSLFISCASLSGIE